MNAANKHIVATLDLPATPAMPRALYLNLGLLTKHLIAVVSVDNKLITSASGAAEMDEHSLTGPALRIGSSQFKLTSEEVIQVRTFLESRADSPCADHSTVLSAKQAAETVATSCDGLGGEPPSSDCTSTGGGALGSCYESVASQVLTSHEHY